MKNVTEGRVFLRRLINDGKDVANKGIKDIGGLLSKVIGLIQPGREAVEDIDQFSPELSVATNADMDASERAVQGLLSNFSVETQRDINAIEEGILAGLRMNARARLDGIAEGRAQVIEELKAGTLSIEDL